MQNAHKIQNQLFVQDHFVEVDLIQMRLDLVQPKVKERKHRLDQRFQFIFIKFDPLVYKGLTVVQVLFLVEHQFDVFQSLQSDFDLVLHLRGFQEVLGDQQGKVELEDLEDDLG